MYMMPSIWVSEWLNSNMSEWLNLMAFLRHRTANKTTVSSLLMPWKYHSHVFDLCHFTKNGLTAVKRPPNCYWIHPRFSIPDAPKCRLMAIQTASIKCLNLVSIPHVMPRPAPNACLLIHAIGSNKYSSDPSLTRGWSKASDAYMHHQGGHCWEGRRPPGGTEMWTHSTWNHFMLFFFCFF